MQALFLSSLWRSPLPRGVAMLEAASGHFNFELQSSSTSFPRYVQVQAIFDIMDRICEFVLAQNRASLSSSLLPQRQALLWLMFDFNLN